MREAEIIFQLMDAATKLNNLIWEARTGGLTVILRVLDVEAEDGGKAQTLDIATLRATCAYERLDQARHAKENA